MFLVWEDVPEYLENFNNYYLVISSCDITHFKAILGHQYVFDTIIKDTLRYAILEQIGVFYTYSIV
jgi:hypothetical protein